MTHHCAVLDIGTIEHPEASRRMDARSTPCSAHTWYETDDEAVATGSPGSPNTGTWYANDAGKEASTDPSVTTDDESLPDFPPNELWYPEGADDGASTDTDIMTDEESVLSYPDFPHWHRHDLLTSRRTSTWYPEDFADLWEHRAAAVMASTDNANVIRLLCWLFPFTPPWTSTYILSQRDVVSLAALWEQLDPEIANRRDIQEMDAYHIASQIVGFSEEARQTEPQKEPWPFPDQWKKLDVEKIALRFETYIVRAVNRVRFSDLISHALGRTTARLRQYHETIRYIQESVTRRLRVPHQPRILYQEEIRVTQESVEEIHICQTGPYHARSMFRAVFEFQVFSNLVLKLYRAYDELRLTTAIIL